MIKGNFTVSGSSGSATRVELKDPEAGTWYDRSKIRLTRIELFIRSDGGTSNTYQDGVIMLSRNTDDTFSISVTDLVDDNDATEVYPICQYSCGASLETPRYNLRRKKLNILVDNNEHLWISAHVGNKTVDVTVFYRIWHTIKNE
jgi:hypothetical protein